MIKPFLISLGRGLLAMAAVFILMGLAQAIEQLH